MRPIALLYLSSGGVNMQIWWSLVFYATFSSSDTDLTGKGESYYSCSRVDDRANLVVQAPIPDAVFFMHRIDPIST